MLNESSYEFVKPGEDFYWYGRPMPKQDEDSIQACMSKEDIAYLMEWQMDMRALVSYGNVNSYLGNDLTNNDYWKTQRCNRGVLNSIDSVCKSWYSAELWNTYSTRQCVSFTLGDQSWESFFAALKTPWIERQQNGQSDSVYSLDKLVPYESRLSATPLSSVYNASNGFPASITSYIQSSPATLWPVADGVRKLYYDLNRISCIATRNYTVENNTGQYGGPNSISYVTQVTKPWDGTSYRWCMVGNLANDTTCTLTQQTYLSGELTATKESVYKYQGSDGFIAKGDPTYTIYANGSWQDVSRWREQKSPYRNYISWTTNGDSHYVMSPRMKGRIEKLAVLANLRVSYINQQSTGTEYNIYKLLELEKSDDVNGYEVWKDSSGFLRDGKSITDLVKSLLETKQSDVKSFSWSFSNINGIVIKLQDLPEKQLHFTSWNWQP